MQKTSGNEKSEPSRNAGEAPLEHPVNDRAGDNITTDKLTTAQGEIGLLDFAPTEEELRKATQGDTHQWAEGDTHHDNQTISVGLDSECVEQLYITPEKSLKEINTSKVGVGGIQKLI